MKKLKCMYCCKIVKITIKNRLEQHHNLPTYKICLGSGDPVALVNSHWKILNASVAQLNKS